MEASVLNVWRPVIFYKTCNRLAPDAVAKLAVGHVPTIRVGHVARHVRHAAAQ